MTSADLNGMANKASTEPVASAPEVKSAMLDFLKDFKTFKGDIDVQLKNQATQIEQLARKGAQLSRPALSQAADTAPPHQKAFKAYVRSGDDDQMRALELDGKGVTTVADGGGFLVDPATATQVQSSLRGAASIRAIAKVVSVEATAYDVLVDHTDADAGWQTETGTLTETATPLVDRISIPLYELSALPKASQRLLDDAAFDVEGWLAERIADKFARAESAAFVNGDGVDKPTGFLTAPLTPADIEDWGKLGYVATGVSGDFDPISPSDAIVDLVYSLGARYRANGSFVMNSKTAGAVRKMKDSDGRFLWSEGLVEGQPARLMGYPVVIVEDMPDISTSAKAIAFGDFAAGYTIAERPDLRILRDPFSARPHVLFYATKRVGGAITDFSAIKLLRFSNS